MKRKQYTQVATLCALLAVLLLPVQAPAAIDRPTQTLSPVVSFLLCDKSCPPPKTLIWQGNQWQRCGDGNLYSAEQAEGYCHDLIFAGYSDWRLPTKDELKSLVVCTNDTHTPLQDYPTHSFYCGDVDLDKTYMIPTVDSSFSCHSGFYWSSTEYYDNYTWGIYFFSGFADWDRSSYGNYVRCVR